MRLSPTQRNSNPGHPLPRLIKTRPAWNAWLCSIVAAILSSGHPLRAQSEASTPSPVTTERLAHGRELYEQHCIACHKARGTASGAAAIPQLAGQQPQYLLEQLQHFISLDRWSPKMHKVVQSADFSNPRSLQDIVAYLSSQPREMHGEHGDPMAIGHGQRLYKRSCAVCHGELGEGSPTGPIPAIGGQNFEYLVTQLRGFAAGHRARVEPDVLNAMNHLSKDETFAVADYISRLPDSATRLNIP